MLFSQAFVPVSFSINQSTAFSCALSLLIVPEIVVVILTISFLRPEIEAQSYTVGSEDGISVGSIEIDGNTDGVVDSERVGMVEGVDDMLCVGITDGVIDGK